MKNSILRILMLFAIVPVVGITITVGCMFALNGAISRREHNAKEVLSSYDDIISCYCDLILQNDSYYSKLYAESLSKMCDERRCCIGAFEICGRRFPKFGRTMRKRTATLYADRKKFPSETMFFGTFKLEDGTVVKGLSYVRRMIHNDKRVILEFKCQLD